MDWRSHSLPQTLHWWRCTGSVWTLWGWDWKRYFPLDHLLASFHHLIAVVPNSEDVRWELTNLLVSVELDLLCVVDRQDLIGIYSHQDRSSVGLQRVVMSCVTGPQYSELTHVNLIVAVSYQKVPQDARLIEVPESNHVLHALYGGGVHRLDPPLLSEPLLLSVVINHLDLVPLQPGDHPGPQGDIELSLGDRLDPDMFPLVI